MTDSTPTDRTPPLWLGPIRQTAFVVDDVDAVARSYVSVHGIGPWFLYDVNIADTDYRGANVPMRARMGLAQSGGQQIELIQPDRSVPSIYREFLDGTPGGGVHHVCYWADTDVATEHFISTGADQVQRGVTSAGNVFVYLTGSAGIPYIEVVDPTGSMKAFFDHIAASSLGWDGHNPIRFH